MNNIIRNNTHVENESWLKFVTSNYKQFVLIFLVALIIYMVEYMAHINTLLYGMLAMPNIPGITNSSQSQNNKRKKKK